MFEEVRLQVILYVCSRYGTVRTGADYRSPLPPSTQKSGERRADSLARTKVILFVISQQAS